ncbi:15180_t:CDS:2 [Dentiscutata heterogama]|uniref:15180_t:CDS:1 n=1 Tax=Dentiscutata heterogama TaxID=1316150 RepID=A0ACA9LLP0_9GLOM|nr:15180_t:CDS:2 [Dentiscutata heterogama]
MAISQYLKQKIYEYNENNSNKTQEDIANHFNSQISNLNLDWTTISKILKNKSKWLAITKSQLSLIQVTNGEIILTELMIKEKATYFAKVLNLGNDALKFSNG